MASKRKYKSKKKKLQDHRQSYYKLRKAEHQIRKRQQCKNETRDPVRDEGREVVHKKVDSSIRTRLGLPEDCQIFRVAQFGARKIRPVNRGTVVLVNLAANKLICVARFNHEASFLLMITLTLFMTDDPNTFRTPQVLTLNRFSCGRILD